MKSQHPETPSSNDPLKADGKVPEPGRIVSRRVGPVGWFVIGLTALAAIIIALMILR